MMHKRLVGLIGILLVASSSGASAADPAATLPAPGSPAAQQAAKTKADPGDRIICEEAAETGSLIAKKKVCMTVSQWRDKAYRSGQWVEHQSTYNSSPNGR
jgi:hypothetical protein